MFLTLGLLADPTDMLDVLLVAVAIGLFMMFVARPLAVFLCLQLFRVPFKAKAFLSWVGLRGAVPIIFATYPVIAGIEDAPSSSTWCSLSRCCPFLFKALPSQPALAGWAWQLKSPRRAMSLA